MSIIQEIKEKYEAGKAKAEHVKEFEQYLIQAVSDGKLSDGDIAELNKRRAEFGLTDDSLKKIKVEGYVAAFNAAKNTGLTADEEKELDKIQSYFELSDQDVISTKRELAHLRLLYEISQGNVPTVQVANVFMTASEKAYWSEPASLLEQKVSHGWQGGNSGFSFHLAKGITYRMGQTKGHIVSSAQSVPVSQGNFIITSKRVIFSGNTQSFDIKLSKLIDVHFYSDGIGLSEEGKVKPRILQYGQRGHNQIIGAVLQYATKHFSA